MKRILFIFCLFAVSLLYAIGSQRVELGYLDSLFLDIKTVLFAPSLNDPEVILVNLSDLKKPEQLELQSENIPKIAIALQESGAKKILLAVSQNEIAPMGEEFLSLAKQDNVLFYSNWENRNFESMGEKQLVFKMTHDTEGFARDGRIRRIYFGMNDHYDEALERFAKFFEITLQPLDQIRSFQNLETPQAFISYVKRESIPVVSGKEIIANPKILEGKKVFIGTEDAFPGYYSFSVMSRFYSGVDSNIKTVSDAAVLINIYENLKNVTFIGQPQFVGKTLYIFIFIFLTLLAIFYLSPYRFVVASFALIILAWGWSCTAYAWLSLSYDFSRILIGIFLIQYLGLPYLLIRTQRKAAEDRVQQEKDLAQEKAKRKFLVQAAVADANLRTVAQVSHDIRSPLMALQIAYRVIKDGISQEASELIKGSIDRLKFIAEDTLSKFKNEHNQESEIDLREAIIDVADTFKVLYPDLQIKIDIPFDVQLLWPTHSLARAFTNLFNNSIEAFGSANGLVISVSTEARDDHHVIRVQDNGPGIPENIIPKLFKAGATFGKKAGTGLGLYQVRKDLEDFGGRIHAEKSTSGALFEIILPRYLEQIGVIVTRKVIAITEVEFSLHASPSIVIQKYRDLATAKVALQQVGNLSEITLFTDLVFTNDEETAFDLIESFGEQKPFKTFVCTSLGENEEIRKLSDKYGVLLVTRSLVSRFVLNIEK